MVRKNYIKKEEKFSQAKKKLKSGPAKNSK